MKFLNPDNIWFSSDLHLNHTNILRYDNREFSTIKEHDETIINNWNKEVAPNGNVLFLGDFCFGDSSTAENYIKRLNGNIIFIKGNHEKPLCGYLTKNKLKWYDYLEIKVRDETLERKWQGLCLFHYPIFEWNKGHHGSWHLHGHCHGNCEINKNNTSTKKMLDMGTNLWKYTPVSYRRIKSIMNKRENITHN